MTATTASPGTPEPQRRQQRGRMIDPRGHRFGAATSVVVLVIGFVTRSALLTVGLPGRSLWASVPSSGRATRSSGVPGRTSVRVFRIAPPKELEHEYPPRFAQALGFIGFTVATVLFLIGFAPVGWIVAAAVGALQAVLAVTGYCLGCRMYFLKWWVPAQFQKLARRTTLA